MEQRMPRQPKPAGYVNSNYCRIASSLAVHSVKLTIIIWYIFLKHPNVEGEIHLSKIMFFLDPNIFCPVVILFPEILSFAIDSFFSTKNKRLFNI